MSYVHTQTIEFEGIGPRRFAIDSRLMRVLDAALRAQKISLNCQQIYFGCLRRGQASAERGDTEDSTAIELVNGIGSDVRMMILQAWCIDDKKISQAAFDSACDENPGVSLQADGMIFALLHAYFSRAAPAKKAASGTASVDDPASTSPLAAV